MIKRKLTERNIYFLVKLLSVFFRSAIPFSFSYALYSEPKDLQNLLIAWTFGYIFLPLIAGGLHDSFIRYENLKLKIIPAIFCMLFFSFLLIVFVCIYYNANYYIYLSILLYNLSYAISILLERYYLYVSDKINLIKLCFFNSLFQFVGLLLVVLKLLDVEQVLIVISTASMFYYFVFCVDYSGFKSSLLRDSFFLYKGSFFLTLQVILLGFFGKIEQLIFASSGESFSQYFYVMRILDAMFIFMSFQSQYSLVKGVSDKVNLKIYDYFELSKYSFYFYLFFSSILFSLYFFDVIKTPRYFLMMLFLGSPLIIFKAINNYHMDNMKVNKFDIKSFMVILFSMLMSLPFLYYLIDGYDGIGALISSWFKFLFFILFLRLFKNVKV